MHKWRTIVLLLLFVAIAAAQTRVDLSKQTKKVDFSAVTSGTKPAQAGTGQPTQACGAGEVFFQLDASAGQNLWVCAPANTWNQLTGSGSGGGGGTPTSTSALTDLRVTYDVANPTVLTVGGNCSSSAPCRVRFGGNTIQLSSATLTITSSGVTVGGMVYIFISSDGTLTIYSTISGSVTCSSNSACSVVTNPAQFQFPSDSVPLATWTASAAQWDRFGGTEMRAFLSNRSSIVQGTGIVIDDTPGQITIKADTSVVGVRVAVPASAVSVCNQGNFAADASFFYQCIAASTWRRVAIATW